MFCEDVQHTFLHLSVQGGSYELRQYDLAAPPSVHGPSCASFEDMKAAHIIVDVGSKSHWFEPVLRWHHDSTCSGAMMRP
jgi:hypothetical protein